MDLRWLLAAVSLTVSGLASANSVNDEPITDNWAPSEWGIDDMVCCPELIQDNHSDLF